MMSEKSLLAIFAHPDDEAYLPGGTLALLARRGVRVQVLTATRGQAGSCAEAYHCSSSVSALYTLAVSQTLAKVLGMPQIRAVPDGAITLTVDVSGVWDAKLKAIHYHTSQMNVSAITRAPLERQR